MKCCVATWITTWEPCKSIRWASGSIQGAIDETIGVRAAAAMGIELDCQFCENIGTSYNPILTAEEAAELGESVLDSGKREGPSDLEIYLERRRRQQAAPPRDSEMTPEQRELELRLEQLRQMQEQRDLENQLNRDRQPLPGAGGEGNPGLGTAPTASPEAVASEPISTGQPIPEMPGGESSAPATRDLAPTVAPIQWPQAVRPGSRNSQPMAQPQPRDTAAVVPTTTPMKPEKKYADEAPAVTAEPELPTTQTIQLVAGSQEPRESSQTQNARAAD